MKKISSIVIVTALFISMVSCAVMAPSSVHGNSGTAPGQEKKETGSQSAKPYAPGQVKKSTGSQSAASVAPGQQKKKK